MKIEAVYLKHCNRYTTKK